MCYDIPFMVGFCLSFCILFMSCISYHVIMCIAFAYVFVSCIRAFSPLVRFPIRRSYLLRCTLLVLFRVRVSNFLGMDRGLSSGLIIPPGDYRSSFVPFGGRLVLQRLTGHPQSPFECPAKPPQNPAQNPPNSLPCSRSFDHEPPSSLYLYKHPLPRNF